MAAFRFAAYADEADDSLDGQIQTLMNNHIPSLEIRGISGVNVTALPRDKVTEVKQKLDACGIGVWAIGSSVGKARIEEPFPAQLEVFQRALETAQIMGASCLRLFSFYGAQDDPGRKDEVVRRLSVFAEKAAGSGVVLCHENERDLYGDTPARALELVQQVPNLKMVFDISNFIHTGVDTLEAWRILGPYVQYLHIKDSLSDGTIVPPGDGEGHVKEILSEFFRRGGGILSLEPHLFHFVGNADAGARYAFATRREAFDAAVRALKHCCDEIEHE